MRGSPLLATLLTISAALLLATGHAKAQDRDPDGTLRFHMTQDGKRMTANDFDLWLARKGLRVTRDQVVWDRSAQAKLAPPPIVQGETQSSAGLALLDGPMALPISTAPTKAAAQYDSSGKLMGYNSGWSSGGTSAQSTTEYRSAGRQTQTTLTSYDSGRD